MATTIVYLAPDCELVVVCEDTLLCASGSRKETSWFDDFNPTKDYYGKHGEFDKNDEARSTSEYIQIFHHETPDADPTDQFHWDEVLDAESDGYLDEE